MYKSLLTSYLGEKLYIAGLIYKENEKSGSIVMEEDIDELQKEITDEFLDLRRIENDPTRIMACYGILTLPMVLPENLYESEVFLLVFDDPVWESYNISAEKGIIIGPISKDSNEAIAKEIENIMNGSDKREAIEDLTRVLLVAGAELDLKLSAEVDVDSFDEGIIESLDKVSKEINELIENNSEYLKKSWGKEAVNVHT